MAQKKQVAQQAARKQELTAQLAAARQSISLGKEQLVERFKPKNLFDKLVRRRPKALFAGSTVAGLALTLLLKRPGKSKKSPAARSTKQILLTWFLSLLKPVAKAWLVARAKKLASERISQPQYSDSGQRIRHERGNEILDV